MDEEATSYPAPQRRPIVRKLAKEPSWILLGFLLGAAFVWLLPDSDDSKGGAATPAPGADAGAGAGAETGAPSASEAVRAGNGSAGGQRAGDRRALPVRRLSTIEAVFEAWGQYAVWEHDLTQIALWSAEHGGYAECYEVMRSGDALYFRSIPKLSRPVINYGTQITSPLLYTETETTRAARAGGRPVPLETPPGNAQSQQSTPPPRVKKAQAFQGEEPRRVEVSLPDALVPPPPPRLQAPDTLTPEVVVPPPEEPTTSPVRKEAVPPQQQTTVPTPPKTTSTVPEPSRSRTSPAPRLSNSGYLRLSSC